MKRFETATWGTPVVANVDLLERSFAKGARRCLEAQPLAWDARHAHDAAPRLTHLDVYQGRKAVASYAASKAKSCREVAMMGVGAWISGLGRRSNLMGRMIERLDVDMRLAARERLGLDVADMAARCRVCPKARVCERWLDGDEMDASYEDFCPNAAIFNRYRRAAVAAR